MKNRHYRRYLHLSLLLFSILMTLPQVTDAAGIIVNPVGRLNGAQGARVVTNLANVGGSVVLDRGRSWRDYVADSFGPVLAAGSVTPACGTCPSNGHSYDPTSADYAARFTDCIGRDPTLSNNDNDMNHNGIPDYEWDKTTACKTKHPCDRDLDHDGIPDGRALDDRCVCSACTISPSVEPLAPGFFADTPAGAMAKATATWCRAYNPAGASACLAATPAQDCSVLVVEPGSGAPVADPIECGEPGNATDSPFDSDTVFNCTCLDADRDRVCQKSMSTPSGSVFYQSAGVDGSPYLGMPVINDNCPGVPNLDQIDTDGDGIGDACDTTPTEVVAGEVASTSSVSPASLPADPFGPCPVCGNRKVESGEQCDDGNTTNGDGCDSSCHLEASPVCGNGTKEGSEQCDDGNLVNDDGCNSTCHLECGNWALNPGEQCDDGNRTNGDGCDEHCKCEPGSKLAACAPPPAPRCGNGVVDAAVGGLPAEECDKGDATHGAGNSDTLADHCRTKCLKPKCGDNVVDTGEDCDGGEGCNNATCHFTQVCGNKIVEGTEQCDDGNMMAGDGCDSACLRECGNGRLDPPGEKCDPSVPGTKPGSCTDDCQPPTGGSFCGNKIVDPGEECDDGNKDNTDDCTNDCKNPVCGDGYVRAGHEACDPGTPGKSASSTDATKDTKDKAASPTGTKDEKKPVDIKPAESKSASTGLICQPDCTYRPTCGDGRLDKGEACDPGLDKSCNSTCTGTGEFCAKEQTAMDGACKDGSPDVKGCMQARHSWNCCVHPEQCTTEIIKHECPPCDGVTGRAKECCDRFGGLNDEALAECFGSTAECQNNIGPLAGGDITMGDFTVTGPVIQCCISIHAEGATVSDAFKNICMNATTTENHDLCSGAYTFDGHLPWFCTMPPIQDCINNPNLPGCPSVQGCHDNPNLPGCECLTNPAECRTASQGLFKGQCVVTAVNPDDVVEGGDNPKFFAVAKGGGCVPVKITYKVDNPDNNPLANLANASTVVFEQVAGPEAVSSVEGTIPPATPFVTVPKTLATVPGSLEPSTTVCLPLPVGTKPGENSQELVFRASAFDLAHNPLSSGDCPFSTAIEAMGRGCSCDLGRGGAQKTPWPLMVVALLSLAPLLIARKLAMARRRGSN